MKETKIAKEIRELKESVRFWKIAYFVVVAILSIFGGLYIGGVI